MSTQYAGQAPAQREARGADTDTGRDTGAVTLTALIQEPSQRALRTRLVLLLTFAAGWTDALAYLKLDKVFASFMTGNMLFVGLALMQGNGALLVRAALALVIFLGGATLGSAYLGRAPHQRSPRAWHGTLAWHLALECALLLVFAVVWAVGGDPSTSTHAVTQVVLLAIATCAMGVQGALIGAFAIPDVVSVALTGTVLLLGQRLAQAAGRPGGDQPGGTTPLSLLALLLSYTLAAIIVTIALPFVGTVFVPCLIVLLTVLLLLMTPERRGAPQDS